MILCMAQSDKNVIGNGMSSFLVPASQNLSGLRLAGTRKVTITPDSVRMGKVRLQVFPGFLSNRAMHKTVPREV
jgi:hypothetical protein